MIYVRLLWLWPLGALTSLIVTLRRLAEGNNTEHVAGGSLLSPHERAQREEWERGRLGRFKVREKRRMGKTKIGGGASASMQMQRRWVRWNNSVGEKMRGEEGLEKWDDNREREREREGEGGLKLGKIDSARGKCERINLETFCKETQCCHWMGRLAQLSPSPPSARFAPTHSHVCPVALPHSPPPAKCHTWTIGIHYTQPGTRLLVGWEMFLGHMLKYNPSLRESRGLRLFKVMWIIARETIFFPTPYWPRMCPWFLHVCAPECTVRSPHEGHEMDILWSFSHVFPTLTDGSGSGCHGVLPKSALFKAQKCPQHTRPRPPYFIFFASHRDFTSENDFGWWTICGLYMVLSLDFALLNVFHGLKAQFSFMLIAVIAQSSIMEPGM